jgi:hypothetical protein
MKATKLFTLIEKSMRDESALARQRGDMAAGETVLTLANTAMFVRLSLDRDYCRNYRWWNPWTWRKP